ncbi:MAG: hypothetical protein K1X75_01770 [Leptospirales bacterium]|nr:hypothetical protein [Leptospirales bacterium]
MSAAGSRSLCFLSAVLAVVLPASEANADTLFLRGGLVLRNVRVLPGEQVQQVVFSDGRIQLVPNGDVLRTVVAPVQWAGATSTEAIRDRVESAIAAERERQENASSRASQRESVAALRNKTGGGWRSALLPGWGQMHQDRPAWAAFFLLGFVAAGAYYSDVDQRYDALNGVVPPIVSLRGDDPFSSVALLALLDTQARVKHQRAVLADERERAAGYMATLYFWSIVDAVVYGRLALREARDQERGSHLDWQLAPAAERVALIFRLRF